MPISHALGWNPDLPLDPSLTAVVPTVLAAFPIAQPAKATAIMPLRRNENYFVTDAAGRDFVLRRYRRNQDHRRVDFQLRFQEHLRSTGFPVPAVVPTSDGRPFAAMPDGAWALFVRAPGEHQEHGRLDQVREAGRRLSEFHNAMRGYDETEVPCEFNPSMELVWTEAGPLVADLEQRYGGQLATEVVQLRRWYAAVLEEWPRERVSRLSVGWVHSDWHGRNMVFQGDRMTGLFDFDPLHRGFLAEDVAYGAFMSARVDRRSPEVTAEALEAFLRGYLESGDLSPDDLAAIPLLAWLPEVPLLPYCLLLESDGQDPVGFMRSVVSSAKVKRKKVRPVLERLIAGL